MKAAAIDTTALSREDYWKYFQTLIHSADIGTTLGALGWILFWFDHIPDHIIHTHFVTGFVFIGALCFGLAGTRIMILTRNNLGTSTDKFFHMAKIIYTLTSSISGIWAYIVFPPH